MSLGVTIKEAQNFLLQNGAEDAILFSNGGDVNLRYNSSLITESPVGRDRVRTNYFCVIVISIGDRAFVKRKIQKTPLGISQNL